MIRSQPYITLPYLSGKSGTSVDVKVDVKNVTERDGTGTGGDQARFFTRIIQCWVRLECTLYSVG